MCSTNFLQTARNTRRIEVVFVGSLLFLLFEILIVFPPGKRHPLNSDVAGVRARYEGSRTERISEHKQFLFLLGVMPAKRETFSWNFFALLFKVSLYAALAIAVHPREQRANLPSNQSQANQQACCLMVIDSKFITSFSSFHLYHHFFGVENSGDENDLHFPPPAGTPTKDVCWCNQLHCFASASGY